MTIFGLAAADLVLLATSFAMVGIHARMLWSSSMKCKKTYFNHSWLPMDVRNYVSGREMSSKNFDA